MKRLTTPLVALLMLAFLVITGAYDYVRLVRERDRLLELTRTEQRIFADTLTVAVRQNVRRGRTTGELQELLEDIRRRPGLLWVAIYDPRGNVVAASVASGDPPVHADPAVTAVLKSGRSDPEPVEGRDGAMVRYVRPWRWPGGGTAAVEVRESLAEADREFASAVREVVVSRLLVLGLFLGCILAVARFSIARPMRALVRAARAIGGGDLAQRIDVSRADELGQLAEEFNRMAASLERAHSALLDQAAERLKLERHVQQAQKLVAVGMLAAEVAHELGSPLNIITGRAEALARSLPADHPDRRHLEVIRRQTERVTGIVRDLREYARPREPQLRELALGELLARVAGLLEDRSRDKGVRIRLDLPPGLPRVLGDPDQLQQVFVNLLANALDASPRWGIVRVSGGPEPLLPRQARVALLRGRAEPPVVTVHVLDEGAGLDEATLAQVFQPFFSTKRQGHAAAGLGLAIVEEIVRAHRGEIEILSVEGRGTEAVVRLPAAPAGGAPQPGAPAPEAVTREA
jgi:signal transduction histidine kinase